MGISNVRGQATIELAVSIPVLMAVAIIGFNVMSFFGECASFDRVFRNAVRIYAVSPDAGETAESIIARIEADLSEAMSSETSVTVRAVSGGLATFTGTMTFQPTVFGQPMRGEIFGIELAAAQHTDEFTVDVGTLGGARELGGEGFGYETVAAG